MVKEDKIKLDVETRGLEEAIEQVEDLREAISTAPRVVIKNPRDCTITVDSSEYNPPQQVAQPEPETETERYKVVKLEKLRELLYLIMMACKRTDDCDGCPMKCVCEEGGLFFNPYKWEFRK